MRSEFLEKNWRRYPSVGDCRSIAEKLIGTQFEVFTGRLERVSADTQRINLSGKIFELGDCLGVGPQRNSHSLQKVSVLMAGDWVYLAKTQNQSVIFLLSPVLHPDQPVPQRKKWQSEWALFIRRVRAFFENRQFLETPTPTLVKCPGTEIHLDFFSTEFRLGKEKTLFYLPTSPELSLKKKLAAGEQKIFEIKNCFRNSEKSEHHSPEFLMLEWYRAFAGLDEIIEDSKALILEICDEFSKPKPKFLRLSVAEAFKKYLNFDLRPQTSLQELQTLAKQHNIYFEPSDSWDDLYFRVFLEKIEVNFQMRPGQVKTLTEFDQDSSVVIFLYDYPPSQAAYARIGSSGWAERFEIYWKGLELANAFHELNDPDIQKQRFLSDLREKRRLGLQVPELDQEFFMALEQGMPPSAGIALGLERLFMAIHELRDISDCH